MGIGDRKLTHWLQRPLPTHSYPHVDDRRKTLKVMNGSATSLSSVKTAISTLSLECDIVRAKVCSDPEWVGV